LQPTGRGHDSTIFSYHPFSNEQSITEEKRGTKPVNPSNEQTTSDEI
jgi:hypothetical protein